VWIAYHNWPWRERINSELAAIKLKGWVKSHQNRGKTIPSLFRSRKEMVSFMKGYVTKSGFVWKTSLLWASVNTIGTFLKEVTFSIMEVLTTRCMVPRRLKKIPWIVRYNKILLATIHDFLWTCKKRILICCVNIRNRTLYGLYGGLENAERKCGPNLTITTKTYAKRRPFLKGSSKFVCFIHTKNPTSVTWRDLISI
jgi:hypothetical protein